MPFGHILLKVRASNVAIPVQVPVIERDELLEIHTSRIGATMLMLMVKPHLFLEINAEGVGATKRWLTDDW